MAHPTPIPKLGTTISTTALLILTTLLISAAAASAAYTNHTVGAAAGWSFDSAANSSAANYSSWAAAQSFSLGDFLIFNTNANTTVVQTYNATTYRLCSADEDGGGDTFVYTGGSPGPGAVAVALTLEGAQYYFSDAGDGVQCARGMRFEINVLHGRGLPPSLAQPPPPPYVDPSPPPGSTADAAAGTTNQNENFYNGAGRTHEVGPVGIASSGIFIVSLVVSVLVVM